MHKHKKRCNPAKADVNWNISEISFSVPDKRKTPKLGFYNHDV